MRPLRQTPRYVAVRQRVVGKLARMEVELEGPVSEAWAQSFLADLPQSAQQDLLDRAHEMEMMRGQMIYRELVHPRYAFLALVVTGLVRTFVTSPGGRRVATRYVRPGGVIGLTSVLIDGAAAGADCIGPGIMLRMDPVTLTRLGSSDAKVGWAIAVQLARELSSGGGARVPNIFGSVRVRVAWHLSQLMMLENDEYVVRLTQQELSESVGSVREVVARVLAQLRDEGVLSRDTRHIIVTDPDQLRQIATSIDS
jgi:CRP/FNR family cyclic AMP-dependent transcriptional regulator